MDRLAKTQYLVKTWMKEQGIDLQLENIEYSIRFLIQTIYDKLPDNKVEELYEAVSNNMESKDN